MFMLPDNLEESPKGTLIPFSAFSLPSHAFFKLVFLSCTKLPAQSPHTTTASRLTLWKEIKFTLSRKIQQLFSSFFPSVSIPPSNRGLEFLCDQRHSYCHRWAWAPSLYSESLTPSVIQTLRPAGLQICFRTGNHAAKSPKKLLRRGLKVYCLLFEKCSTLA